MAAPDDTPLAALRLARSPRVGPATFHRLMAAHGDAAAALAALPALAAEAGVESYRPCPEGVARAELAAGRKAGARLLVHGAPDYPARLAQIDDAPPVLWALGDTGLAAGAGIALAGARNASALGCRMAAHLARGLGAAGFAVISGLARGIDTAAHEAALDTGTVAVFAGGVDVIYPRENAALAARIAARGLILSEMPPGTVPQARHFPRRNRIISGLVPALVVVEGAAKSGSLITARTALDQGREVMAVPGHPFDARAAGCNRLIRDGATLVRDADDVIAALGRPEVARPRPAAATASLPGLGAPAPPAPRERTGGAGLLQRIVALLGPAPVAEDAVIRAAGAPPREVLAALSDLDIAGRIERHPGGMISAGGDPPPPH